MGVPRAAQSQELTGTAKAEMLQKISQKALQEKQLSCTFTQTKQSSMLQQPVTMKGKMRYQRPNQLRWEYVQPEQRAYLIQGDSLFTEKNGLCQPVTNRMMKGITSMVMGCVSGRQLFNEKDFKTRLYNAGRCYRAELVPQRSDLKRMFRQMILLFSKESLLVTEVQLIERQGDTTTIQFQRQQTQ